MNTNVLKKSNPQQYNQLSTIMNEIKNNSIEELQLIFQTEIMSAAEKLFEINCYYSNNNLYIDDINLRKIVSDGIVWEDGYVFHNDGIFNLDDINLIIFIFPKTFSTLVAKIGKIKNLNIDIIK